METKRLGTEVLNRIAKQEKSAKEKSMNELTFEVFNNLLDAGHEVVISKTDLTMLHSLNVELFKRTISDQVFKNTQAATPVT